VVRTRIAARDGERSLMLTNRSIPSSTVIPVLAYDDVLEAARWLCAAFGLTERLRIGDHRVQMTFGAGAVVAAERGDKQGTSAVLVRVEDADAHHAHASANGARIVRPPESHPYGERQYTAEDLAGHRWTFSQSIADVAPEEWGGEVM
jgi:uncharacterized glyoxalase superfamily protein PhnB